MTNDDKRQLRDYINRVEAESWLNAEEHENFARLAAMAIKEPVAKDCAAWKTWLFGLVLAAGLYLLEQGSRPAVPTTRKKEIRN